MNWLPQEGCTCLENVLSTDLSLIKFFFLVESCDAKFRCHDTISYAAVASNVGEMLWTVETVTMLCATKNVGAGVLHMVTVCRLCMVSIPPPSSFICSPPCFIRFGLWTMEVSICILCILFNQTAWRAGTNKNLAANVLAYNNFICDGASQAESGHYSVMLIHIWWHPIYHHKEQS